MSADATSYIPNGDDEEIIDDLDNPSNNHYIFTVPNSTIFNIIYQGNAENLNSNGTYVYDDHIYYFMDALKIWSSVLNHTVPPQGKVTIKMNLKDDGNNGTLGYAGPDYFTTINNIKYTMSGTFTLNTFYTVSQRTVLHEIGHILGVGYIVEFK